MAKDNKKATAARRHSMPTTIGGYENLLISMIEKRTGAEFDEFLLPQVSACAQCWMMLNKVHDNLMKERSLREMVLGSKDQQKNEVNPLLPSSLIPPYNLECSCRRACMPPGRRPNGTEASPPP